MPWRVEHIACVGSSFAAGPGITPIVDANCSRSGRNYAHQVAQRLGGGGARLTDLSVSGATLDNLLDTSQTVAPGVIVEPQLERLPADVDLVLVTAGGNDMSYISNMIRDAIRATWIGWFLFMLLSLFPIPKSVDATQDELVQRLGRVLDTIHTRAPQARVLLVEYVALLGGGGGGESDDAARAIGFTAQQIAQHNDKAERLTRAYAQAASSQQRSAWCSVIEMHQRSKAHAIGTAQPWVTGFSLYDVAILRKVPFHPTLEGMTAIADRIVEHIEAQ